MLETLRTQEYYLAMGEEHPLLQRVIEGEASLGEIIRKELDSVERVDDACIEAIGLLTAIHQHTRALEDVPHDDKGKALGRDALYTTAGGYIGTIATLAAVLPLLPVAPIGLVLALGCGGALASVGAGAGAASLRNRHIRRQVEANRKEILQPLCELALQVDSDVGRCFILDHFHGEMKRFERTYASLADEERALVGQELYRMLSAGALDMGEHELDSYLAGLAGKEETQDD